MSVYKYLVWNFDGGWNKWKEEFDLFVKIILFLLYMFSKKINILFYIIFLRIKIKCWGKVIFFYVFLISF